MSRAPLLYNKTMVNWLSDLMMAKSLAQKLKTFAKFRPGHLKPVIAILRGLTDPVVGLNMGQTAENIAANFGISREQMDSFAVDSHIRLAAAHEACYLDEIEPVYDSGGKHYDHDDGVRPDSSVEKLARLRYPLSADITGKRVLLLDDVSDTGDSDSGNDGRNGQAVDVFTAQGWIHGAKIRGARNNKKDLNFAGENTRNPGAYTRVVRKTAGFACFG